MLALCGLGMPGQDQNEQGQEVTGAGWNGSRPALRRYLSMILEWLSRLHWLFPSVCLLKEDFLPLRDSAPKAMSGSQ